MIPLSIVLENDMKQPNKIFEVVRFSLNTLHILNLTPELPELVVPVLRKKVILRPLWKEILKNVMADNAGTTVC